MRDDIATSSGTTYYLYDGSSPVLEETYSGSTTTIAFANGYADGWRERYTPAGPAYFAFCYDPQGSLSATSDSALQDDEPNLSVSVYDGFGNRVVSQEVDSGMIPAGHQDPAQFGGQYGYYTDLSTGEVDLTHRYYDAGTGHFLNRDPIGYAGGANLYAFCGNNPVNESDPEGFGPRHHRRKTAFYIQPQTIVVLPGKIVQVTNTTINVDIDGSGGLLGAFKQDRTSTRLDGNYPNPAKIPYLVLRDPRAGSNFGVNIRDFGAVTYKGKTVSGVFADSGHSVGGEASVRVHFLLGSNPGPRFLNAIDQSGGASVLAFPGSGKGFHGKYTEKNIEAYGLELVETYFGNHYASGQPSPPAITKQTN